MDALVAIPVLVLAVAGLFVVAGVRMATGGGRSLTSRADRTGWERVPGRIVDWEGRWLGPVASRERWFFPVVEHELPGGEVERFVNPTGRNQVPWRQRRGGPAVVLRDPADPRRAELESTQRDRATLGAVHVVFGAVFAIAGLVIAVITVAVWILVA